MIKTVQPVTKSIKDVSEVVAKTMTESSKENNKALANLNDKFLETVDDRGILASYLLSPSIKIMGPEYTSQLNLVRNPDSNRVKALLINETLPVTLHDILLTFRDTDEKFELEGDFLKTITDKNCNIDLGKLTDKEVMFEFAKEIYFDENVLGNKSIRDKFLIRLLCLNHLLSWLLGFPQRFYQKNLSTLWYVEVIIKRETSWN